MNSMLQDSPSKSSSWLRLLMSTACGLAVANLYYCQPLLAEIGRSFASSSQQMGTFVTFIQSGYACGLLFVVPLGDKLNRRALITNSLAAVGVALAVVAAAPTITILLIAGLAMGITAVAPQLIIPYAAAISSESERGNTVGKVLTGLFIGILMARTVGGVIGGLYGWRVMYWLAALLMLVLAFIMKRALPQDYAPKEPISYLALLRSLWLLLRTQPILRETVILGGMAFGAFSAFWVTLAFFLETPPYHYGSEVAGLLGVVGVGGALAANGVGKLADKCNPRRWNAVALAIMFLSFISMLFIGQWLPGLVLSVFLLDIGARMNMTLNQARIFNLNPELRNRLNSVYMLGYYLGGAIGSWLGISIWSIGGWNGVCILTSGMVMGALFIYNNNSNMTVSKCS